jgi:lipoate-protein ligase A
MNLIKYNLPDFEILESNKDFAFSIWQPDKKYIILGRSNNAEDSVFIEKAVNDNIEILKRPSGGETVILSPKTLVISVKLPIDNSLKVHKYFALINEKIIEALQNLGIENLRQKGISDISIGEKKILGSSIYKKPNSIFYHAVLNISESPETLEKYLKHPKREPDYRNGRKHSDFVTSLKNEIFEISSEIISGEISKTLSQII